MAQFLETSLSLLESKARNHLVSGFFKDQVSLAGTCGVCGSLGLGWKRRGWAEAEGTSAKWWHTGHQPEADPGLTAPWGKYHHQPMTFLVRYMETMTG